MSDSTTGQNETLTLGRIIKALSPGQVWSILGAIVGVLISVFTAGQKFNTFEKGRTEPTPVRITEPTPVPCYQAKDWPKGVWLAWGHIKSDWKPIKRERDGKFPQIVSRVQFDSNMSFGAVNDHPMRNQINNQLTATLDKAMQPNAVINIHGVDGTKYTVDVKATVTADGCMIKGDFTDTSGNQGTINYLFERERYYVQP